MRVHQRGSREKGSEGEDLATEGPSERADAESLEVDERESVAAFSCQLTSQTSQALEASSCMRLRLGQHVIPLPVCLPATLPSSRCSGLLSCQRSAVTWARSIGTCPPSLQATWPRGPMARRLTTTCVHTHSYQSGDWVRAPSWCVIQATAVNLTRRLDLLCWDTAVRHEGQGRPTARARGGSRGGGRGRGRGDVREERSGCRGSEDTE